MVNLDTDVDDSYSGQVNGGSTYYFTKEPPVESYQPTLSEYLVNLFHSYAPYIVAGGAAATIAGISAYSLPDPLHTNVDEQPQIENDVEAQIQSYQIPGTSTSTDGDFMYNPEFAALANYHAYPTYDELMDYHSGIYSNKMTHLFHPLNNPSMVEYNELDSNSQLDPYNNPEDRKKVISIVKNVEARSNYVMNKRLPKLEEKYPNKKYVKPLLNKLKAFSDNPGAIPKFYADKNNQHDYELYADLVPEIKEVFKEITRDNAVDLTLKRTKLPEDVFPLIKQYEGRGEIFNPRNKDQGGTISKRIRKMWRDEGKTHLLNIHNPDLSGQYLTTDTGDELRRKRKR